MSDNLPAFEKLPLLPGYNFDDVKKNNHHKAQCFDIKFGVPKSKVYIRGPGDSERDVDSVQFNIHGQEIGPSIDPTLVYGRRAKSAVRPFRPHYVTYDRSCLKFQGYFQQQAFHTPDESYRIRLVNILYFLEDDTLTVIEPSIPNSGLPQGRLVRRSRIPQGPLPDCEYLHWKDLNLDKAVRICGFNIFITDCDAFTKQFLESQGVELNPPTQIPNDEFTRKKSQQLLPRNMTCNEPKLKQFLRFDGVILKFRAVWENEEGIETPFGVSYFLSDSTIQITEIHEKNDGKDPFPVLLKRTKLPKVWAKVPLVYPSEAAEETTEFYQPSDLLVGGKLMVFGRELLLHMCDDFTRNFYKTQLNITQPPNFSVKKESPRPPKPKLPPYTGLGSLEDSLQSCLSFTMKSPRKDVVRKIVNANQTLRYKAKLRSCHPEDEDREFILTYSLADGTIMLTEPPRRNSGHVGGKFLASMRVPKPGTSPDFPEYYTPHDFFIGNTIIINDFRFEITGADAHVYTYMQDNPEKFQPHVVESIRAYVEKPVIK